MKCRRPRHFALCALIFAAIGCGHMTEPVTIANLDLPPDLPEFNRLVLEVAAEYPTDGTHGYYWPKAGDEDFVRYDGCTRDMFYLGKIAMRGEPQSRSFCCGFTLEVFLETNLTDEESHVQLKNINSRIDTLIKSKKEQEDIIVEQRDAPITISSYAEKMKDLISDNKDALKILEGIYKESNRRI